MSLDSLNFLDKQKPLIQRVTIHFLLHSWGTILLSPQHPPIIQSNQPYLVLSSSQVIPFGSSFAALYILTLHAPSSYNSSRLDQLEIMGSVKQVGH